MDHHRVVVVALPMLTILLACIPLTSAAQELAAGAPAVTDCDRQASHPEDPNRVAPGVERKDIDLVAATAACEQALATEPGNARARYQLARLLFYGNQNSQAVAEMKRAADAGYPQAQFVFGTFVARMRPGAPTDICVAEDYWRNSAAGGRQAARVQYLRYTLKGRFDDCAGRLPEARLLEMLETAAGAASDFYERLVLEDLTEGFRARAAPSPN